MISNFKKLFTTVIIVEKRDNDVLEETYTYYLGVELYFKKMPNIVSYRLNSKNLIKDYLSKDCTGFKLAVLREMPTIRRWKYDK